jgi:dTDP-rhamnose C3-O-methyltransferase
MSDTTFDGTRHFDKDSEIENQLIEHCANHDLTPLEALKLFPVLARRQWLKRFLAHVELFKMTLDVPGDIAELGVFRGAGLFTWANLLESYCVGDRTKTVWGFDNWSGFTPLSEQDGSENEVLQKKAGGFCHGTAYRELLSALHIFDNDRFVGWKNRITLYSGNIEESSHRFVEEHPGVRFSLVHFDCDLYAPTKAALAALWSKVSRGGVVIFDEYSIREWPGETQAVDEFFKDKSDIIRTFPWTNIPGGYIVKQ